MRLAPPLWWRIDGWTLCDSTWMFRVLRRWWWCSAEKCCATGMAISCSRGPKSGHSRFLPARDACKLDTANTRNCLFSPDGLWWFVLVPYVLFIPTENLYLFFTRNLAFMFTIYSHFTVLWADMWEAGWQMFNISCLNTFARMMNVEITSLSLSLSLNSSAFFLFLILTANQWKMRCDIFCIIGIPCGGIQLKGRSYFVK